MIYQLCNGFIHCLWICCITWLLLIIATECSMETPTHLSAEVFGTHMLKLPATQTDLDRRLSHAITTSARMHAHTCHTHMHTRYTHHKIPCAHVASSSTGKVPQNKAHTTTHSLELCYPAIWLPTVWVSSVVYVVVYIVGIL